VLTVPDHRFRKIFSRRVIQPVVVGQLRARRATGDPTARRFARMPLLSLTNDRWGFASNCFACEPTNEAGLRIPFSTTPSGRS